jgi:hypothetical protein
MLREQDFSDAARQLEDGIANGATASEILMAARFHLKEIQKSKRRIDNSGDTTIVSLLKDLDQLLSSNSKVSGPFF